MRKTINPQPNLREPWVELEHARELETISSLLDAHPKLNELVLQDLKSVTPSAGSDVGRGGMSTEQVLGCVPRSVEKERRPPLRHRSIMSGGDLRVFENLAQTLVAVDAS